MQNLLLTISLPCLFGFTAQGQQNISVVTKPGIVFIEQGENKQLMNMDFLCTNTSADTLVLTKITVTVIDKNNKRVHTRFLDNNGTAPGINIISNRELNGPSSQLIFNPFTDFSATMPLEKLNYEFVFTDNKDREQKVTAVIYPEKYLQKQAFTFPLQGRVLVYDGHDLYAHHRRFNYEFAPIKGLGLSSNFMRYAYDFVLLNNNNDQFANEGKKDEDYFGFGNTVNAIGTGKVIYASNKFKDDKTFNIPELANNPLELYGNCIAIQHPGGAVSIYAHLKQNSIKVKVGDGVMAKQAIANIGVSGSSFFPHLHFELRTSIKGNAEGIPSYFSNIYLLEGAAKRKLNSGLAETGNIIEAK